MTSSGNTLPFAEIAAACLSQAEGLVAEWLPGGRREGPEWKALNPTRADGKIGSFSVNVVTGAWGDFACDDKGGDLVSLYAYLFFQGDQGKAAVELAERFGIALPKLEGGRPGRKAGKPAPPKTEQAAPAAPKEKPPRTWWKPVWPVPTDAEEPPKAHPNRGIPSRIFTYRDPWGLLIGHVCRFVTSDGGKDDIPLVFAEHEKSKKREWRWMAFAEEGRPLYGLDRATSKPAATLLFVEGEKCADAGDEALPELACLTWPGGCNGVDKADFSTIAEREVKKAILFPDCDAKREKLTKAEKEAGIGPMSKPLLPEDKQPGMKAMLKVAAKLHAMGYAVWIAEIPKPGEKQDGWDIADAIAEGWTQATLAEFLRSARRWSPPDAAPPPEAADTPSEAGAGKEKKGPFIPGLIWGRDGLKNCLSNVYQILAHRPEWRGVVAYDEFALCVVKRKAPPFAEGSVGDWDSTDDSRTAMWLAQLNPEWAFTPSSDLVAEAIEVLGRSNAFHPVRDYLRSLEWDGTPRLEAMLSDFLGVPCTPYSMRAGKWWLMGAVKRVLQPGAKFDYCLVLCGDQGKKKSTFFSVIGGAWFSDSDLDLNSKDGMSGLKGVLIQEFAELGSLARSEEKKQKSFLSRSIDHYRPVYGRREIKAPRQVVFCGTTNEHEWNKDPTGGRRFWPVDCQFDEIDVAALAAVRDQLFAEAAYLVEQGERYWPTREEQREWFDPEQLKVEQQDSIADAIHDWVYAQAGKFSIWDIARDCLKLDASKLTRDLQTRIGNALTKFKCKKVEKRNGTIRYWYEPPERKEASSMSGEPAQPSEGGDDVGF